MENDHLEICDIKPEFSVGDKVRISKKKKTFEKGYTTRWTEEIFTIVEVKRTSPVTYKIADLNGEEIKGSFYEPELQKTSQQLFRIEKVIKRGKKKSLVKWKGYSDDFNSWVLAHSCNTSDGGIWLFCISSLILNNLKINSFGKFSSKAFLSIRYSG